MSAIRRLLLLLILPGMCLCNCKADGPSAYGKKQPFAKGVPVAYPDFTLTYLGTRHQASHVYPRGFTYHDFRIAQSGTEKTISWSAGTGDIAPMAFEFQGNRFELELRLSDKLGKLAENEVVLWKK